MIELRSPMSRYFVAPILALTLFGHATLPAQRLQKTDPASVGLNASKLDGIEDLVRSGLEEKKMPGCVVCVGRQGRIAYLKAFGNRKLGAEAEAMTTDTVFDMASITKPVATATSIMKLVENGQLRLGDKAVKFFPAFAPHGKDEITIQDMLIHQSGLIPDNSLKDYENGPEVAWEKICNLDLVAPVGTTFKYSDVNFIVLAKIVEEISGKNVHEFSRDEFFGPLGMKETGYLPSADLKARSATTEKRDGEWMRGEVHDPRAYELGGIAGHAGLFSTAEDLAVYAHMMLGQGTFTLGDKSVRVLSPRTVEVMTRGYRVSSGYRGLGWDKQTGYSSNRGDLLSSSAFGHGGFTGTVLWIDPELDLFFIFLSNRVHPDGKGSVNHLAGQIVNLVVSSLTAPPRESTSAAPAKQAAVLAGVDVLRRDNFRQLADQRVGLITNHTGRCASGMTTIELLHQAENVRLAALFSPEHGIAGKLDISKISNTTDTNTGLEVFSLYGETRRPTREMLDSVDVLVFDIQDIGTRFYTYISTMGEAMIAAAENDKRFVVLDRPNPIGGQRVRGPMLDKGKESFVGFHSLPVRHGMTIGEIAMMLRNELELELELDVIECEGWNRGDSWETTNLVWVNPSPNMRCLNQAFLYPGIGLLETTNVSVGRGTDTPFEVLGAPWIDAQELAAELNARQIPGVVFVPIEFTPESSKHADQLCDGINIEVVDRSLLEPVRVGLEIAVLLRQLYPDDWDHSGFDRLLKNDRVFEAVIENQGIDAVLAASHRNVKSFLRRRAEFLLYR